MYVIDGKGNKGGMNFLLFFKDDNFVIFGVVVLFKWNGEMVWKLGILFVVLIVVGFVVGVLELVRY